MTKDKDPDLEWIGEWYDVQENFPDWAPELVPPNAADVPVLTRLCTYPEMELVWAKLYEWLVSANKNSVIPHTSRLFTCRCPNAIRAIALRCTAQNLGIDTLTTPKRRKLIEKMTGQARALSQSLRELVVPESVTHYMDWETRFEEERERELEFMYHHFPEEEWLIEILHRLDTTGLNDHGPGDDDSVSEFPEPLSEEQQKQLIAHFRKRFPHRSEEKIIEGVRILTEPTPEPRTDWDEDLMSRMQDFHKQSISQKIAMPSAVSIYDVLNLLIDFENFDLPEPIVKKAKGDNERKLLAIRLIAKFVKYGLKRNPRSSDEREVIAALARTILDNSDIWEDTVKDALKEYQI